MMRIFLSTLFFLLQIQANLTPWYTGSLLALSGVTVPAGQFAWQPYIFFTDNYGKYDDNFSLSSTSSLYQLQPLLVFQGGITSFSDFEIVATSFSNFRKEASSTNIGDTSALIGLQLLRSKPNTHIPDIRFTITEIFPTGKYDNLSPSKLGTDATGNGAYETQFGLNFQKLFYPHPCHPLRVRVNFFYNISARFNASNLHIFGGEIGAVEKIKPGDQFSFIVAPEYSINKHWVITTDITYQHTNKTHIKRVKPVREKSTLPSQDVITLAPAIEYNFSDNFGVLGGVWFTVTGRNTNAFASPVFSLVYSF